MRWNIRRNHIWGVVLSLLLLFLILSLPDTFLDSEDEFIISQVASLGIPVENIEKMSTYYQDVFGCKKIHDSHLSSKHLTKMFGGEKVRVVLLKLGNSHLTLIENRALSAEKKIDSVQQITILVKDIDLAKEKLMQGNPWLRYKEASIDTGSLHPLKLLLFRDPEGNPFQLRQVAKSSKRPPIFVAISHTSLLVSDLDSAKKFYRELLGLEYEEQSIFQGFYPWKGKWVNEKFQTMKFRAPNGPSIEFLKPNTPTYYPEGPFDNIWFAKCLSTRLYTLKNLLKLYDQGSYEIMNIHSQDVDFNQAMLIEDPNHYKLLIVKP